MAVLLLTDGGLQADRLLGHTHDLAHLIHRHLQALGNFLGAGVMAVLMQQLAGDLLDLVDGLDHMHRDADGAGLVGNGAGDGLTDPPRCVGRELEALGVVELFHSLDQAQVTLLDQVQELHAAADVTLGDGNDQTQVGFAQALFGFLALGAAGLNFQGQVDLLLGGQQGHAADLFQVDLDGVVDGNAVGIQGVVEVVGAFLSGAAQQAGVHIADGVIIDNLDTVALQFLVELFHLLHVQDVTALLHRVADLAVGQLAGTAAGLDQAADRIFLFCHKYVLLWFFI